MAAPRTMILLTIKANNEKKLYTSLPSLIRKRPELNLKHQAVYGYIHQDGVVYATDQCTIERLAIIYNGFKKAKANQQTTE